MDVARSASDRPERFVFASRNRGKLAQVAHVAAGAGLETVGLDAFPGAPEVEETGTTYAENARLKAVSALLATGLPALADDSGLEVDALGGAPGVHSARFAGPRATDADNNRLLLRRLEEAGDRRARYVCVLAWAVPGRPVEYFKGETRGRIALEPHGGGGGFGYDPLFVSDETGAAFSDDSLSLPARLALSHRGRALRAWLKKVRPSPARADDPRGDLDSGS